MGAELVTGAARRVAALIGMVALLAASTAAAAVGVTASRSELLYSADSTPDCSKLHGLEDGALPLNVVRLRATVDGTTPGDVRYRWSVPPGQLGMLAADLDLGPADQTAAVRALATDFGNACNLTPDKLPFYNYPTILWVAPTCDALADPKKRTAFLKGAAKVGVSVTRGKQRLGKASTAIGYGRAARISLFVDGKASGGRNGSVPVYIQPFFGATVSAPGIALPESGEFQFENGDGGFTSTFGCGEAPPSGDLRQYAACTSRMLYQRVGKFVPSVKEKFDDGSALCADGSVRVLSAIIKPRLTVKATPSGTYVPGDPTRGTARLTVTLKNESPRQGGSGILLIGNNVLTCDSELKITGTEDHRQTVFDLQHCSATHDQPCSSDLDCSSFVCPDCAPDETCLLQSHCSQTYTQPCLNEMHCKAPACVDCVEDEHCIQVLNTPAIVVGIGESVNLIDRDVSVANLFPGMAKVSDLWTVNSFNAGPAEAKMRYRIKPNPAVR